MVKYIERFLGLFFCLVYRIVYLREIRVSFFNSSLPGYVFISNGTVTIDKGTNFRRGGTVNVNGGALNIGRNVFFNQNVSINCRAKINIGSNSMIGESVVFYDHDHTFSKGLACRKEFVTSDINVGENVWIGCNCTILKGVSIGDNSVIAAGSIVTKDLPPNSTLIQKRDAFICVQ